MKVLTDPVRGVRLGGFFPSPGSLSLFSFVAVLLFGSVNLGYINGHILDVIVDVVHDRIIDVDACLRLFGLGSWIPALFGQFKLQ